MSRPRPHFKLILRHSSKALFSMALFGSACKASPIFDLPVFAVSVAPAGYDGLPVREIINSDVVEITGTIPQPRSKRVPSANRYAECATRQAECRSAQVRFPKGYAVDYQSRPQYWAREIGSTIWIELVNPRPMSRADATGHYQSVADVRPGEYNEFPGFSLQPVALSGNCGIGDRDVSQWEFVNIREGINVEFRIRLHVKDCGKISSKTDTAD
jgi:hypothetical protein